MLTQKIRRNFLQYFKKRNHAVIPSSPVIPLDDPTLLFTNAGMNQFKDVFLGRTKRDYVSAATSQKCIRVGGKHNDLENVGHTRRHLTFFEMLGNFSFGDYFKEEAIQFAWEVSIEVFELDPHRIWPTVYRDDEEAFELWKKYVPADRITRFGEKENFWSMGDTGPCGPSSELLYDRGNLYGSAKNPSEDLSGERFLEYWNLVFMQYNRQADGTQSPLPKPSIDTGAGLERVISLKMDVDSVFETDVLRSLISQTEMLAKIAYTNSNHGKDAAFRVIADHLRTLSFAIADGVLPSNVDRGYVLRKVLRRAVRYGRTLGFDQPFLAEVLPALVQTMGEDYPEIYANQHRIADILTREEDAFIRTLRRGGNILSGIIKKAEGVKIISGEDAFKLKDTYGFPFEEILLLAKDCHLAVDTARYDALEQEAKLRSQKVHKTTEQIAGENLFAGFVNETGPSVFTGYWQHTNSAIVKALVVKGVFVNEMHAGDEGVVILDRTPFYAEMGGQVGDTGVLHQGHIVFNVENCISPYKGVIAHVGALETGTLVIGQLVVADIDIERRQKIANNHTATHLLHWALAQVLGESVKQAGSVVDAEHLRFDFNHYKALTQEELEKIEDLVNAKIRMNTHVKDYEIPYEEAQKDSSIKQFFGDKYGSKVRVIDIEYSKELCGGTHTSLCGNIGFFRIAKEHSIAAGVRRIEAVTGQEAQSFDRKHEQMLSLIADKLKTQPQKLQERVDKLIEENKELASHIKIMKKEQLDKLVHTLLSQTESIGTSSFVCAEVQATVEDLRWIADEIMKNMDSGVLVLAAKIEDRCQLIIRVTEDLHVKNIKAIELIKELAPIIEGSGGGKGNAAQAGGKAPHKISQMLEDARRIIAKML